jgi:hypothetical protein
MIYDLGDVVPLGITITDASNIVGNATAVTCTIYLPDGTTSTGTVVNADTGLYNCDFVPTLTGRHAVKWLATGTNAGAFSDDFTVRDFSEIGIVGLQEVKEYLNIPATLTTSDEEIRRYMDAANDLAEQYTGVILGQRTYSDELYDGVSADAIRLRSPKAINIISVTENGVSVPSTGYYLDPTGQRLYRIGSNTIYATNNYGYWAPGVQNISISYRAGFVNPPMAAKQGVLEIIRHLWQSQRGGMNVMSRSNSGDELYSTPTYSLPRRAMELLDPVSLPGMA